MFKTPEDAPALNVSVVEFDTKEMADNAGGAILQQSSSGGNLYLFAVALY